MKLFGLVVLTEKQLFRKVSDEAQWNVSQEYEMALLDTGFTNYIYAQPDPEVLCRFARHGCKPFISKSAWFRPEFNVAGLFWRECK